MKSGLTSRTSVLGYHVYIYIFFGYMRKVPHMNLTSRCIGIKFWQVDESESSFGKWVKLQMSIEYKYDLVLDMRKILGEPSTKACNAEGRDCMTRLQKPFTSGTCSPLQAVLCNTVVQTFARFPEKLADLFFSPCWTSKFRWSQSTQYGHHL